MRILIVSGKEYSESNRGIDIITGFLSKQHEIEHLFFYTRKKTNDRLIKKNLTQKFFTDREKIYRDKFKYFLPGFIITFIFKKMIRCSNFDFGNYDYIILESGYPVFIGLFVDRPIIYRQSDPIEIAFNTNRKYFKKVEEIVLKKSVSVSSALNPMFYPANFKDKIFFWKSGYLSPKIQKQYIKKKQIVYMGGVPVDYFLIKKIAKLFLDYTFIIIGNHKDKIHLQNVMFTGYLNFKDYYQIILESECFFFPIAKGYLSKLKKCDITSKFYLPIEFGIPIVAHAYGNVTKPVPDKKIFVYKDTREIVNILKRLLDTNIDFTISEEAKKFIESQSLEYKEEELYVYFRKICLV